MNHPVMHDMRTNQQYSSAPLPPAPGQYGALPPTPRPGEALPSASSRRRPWLIPAGVAGTAVVALIAGVTLGAVFASSGSDSGASDAAPTAGLPTNAPGGVTPSAAEVHAQDVSLCTSYAIINSAIPRPDRVGSDLLPAVTALKVALAENPDASAPVRVAVTDIASVYQARVAEHGKVRTRGLAEPPPYSLDAEKNAVDQVWTACGLDEE